MVGEEGLLACVSSSMGQPASLSPPSLPSPLGQECCLLGLWPLSPPGAASLPLSRGLWPQEDRAGQDTGICAAERRVPRGQS